MPPQVVVARAPQQVTEPLTATQLAMQRRRATDEQLTVFYRGVDAVLLQWTALNLVVEHNDVNGNTAMRDHLRGWFAEEGELFSDELEDYFDEFFLATRFAAIEDGSPKEVADVLHEMYVRCCSNDDSTVNFYIKALEAYRASGVATQCQFQGATDAQDDDDDDDAGVTIGEALGGDDDDDDAPAVADAQPAQGEGQRRGRGKNPYTSSAGGWKTVARR